MAEPLSREERVALAEAYEHYRDHMIVVSVNSFRRALATVEAAEAERDELREKAAAWDSIPTPADGPANTSEDWRQAYIERMREGAQLGRERDEQRARAERYRAAIETIERSLTGPVTWAWTREFCRAALADQDPTPPGVEAVTYYTVRCAGCGWRARVRLEPFRIRELGWTLGEDGRYRCPGCAGDGGPG